MRNIEEAAIIDALKSGAKAITGKPDQKAAKIERLKEKLPQCDVNMALVIEGKNNDELPEQVLGAVGLRGLDILDPGLAQWPHP